METVVNPLPLVFVRNSLKIKGEVALQTKRGERHFFKPEAESTDASGHTVVTGTTRLLGQEQNQAATLTFVKTDVPLVFTVTLTILEE